MYVYGTKLILGTAQDLDTAEEVWSGAVELATETDENDLPLRPDLARRVKSVSLVNGKKSLNLYGGERWKVKAANRRAGRGLSGDVVILDELREHQSWDAWGAITKTTMARAMALILALSNAGDSTSIVLRHLRGMCLQALVDSGREDLRAELDEMTSLPGDGESDDSDESDDGGLDDDDDELSDYVAEGIDDLEALANEGADSIALFEWSAPPGCPVTDRTGWAAANPSMGHTISERTIAAACATDPDWVFRVEVLCQWNAGAAEGPFPAGSWDSCLDPVSSIVDAVDLAVGVDVSRHGKAAHIVFAGHDQFGQPHVELVASRPGTDWVIPWLLERFAGSDTVIQRPIRAVAVQGRGAPASALRGDIEAAGLPLLPCEGPDLTASWGDLYQLVRGGKLRRLTQPILDVAAGTAVLKAVGDLYLVDRVRSPSDASPLIAAQVALWALTHLPKPKPKAKAVVHEWPDDLLV